MPSRPSPARPSCGAAECRSVQPVMTEAVGFDLDMTLIDSRPGIAATYRALSARTGVHVDADLAVSRLGPPLRQELREWFPLAEVEDAVRLYRALYPRYAIEPSRPTPGAREALAAVHTLGLRVVVVTSKIRRLAAMHLKHLGMAADEVAGDRFAEGKAVALRVYGARWFVGDHVGDMVAATTAGVPGIGVATGPCSATELEAAGAAYVLDDLTAFPALLGRIALGSAEACG
jgi:phosphoglycolate phosphatase